MGQGQTVTIVDVSTSTPTQAASLGFPGEPGIVLPNGDVAYVAYAFGDLVNVVEQVDISNPFSPMRMSSSTIGQTGKTVYGMSLSGGHIVMAQEGANGFKTVDHSSTSSLSVVSTLNLTTIDVFATGTYAYVVTGEFFGGASNELVVVDISNPSSPSQAGSITVVGAEGVFVTGGYAYVFGGSNKGLSIIDVTTPGNPTLAGTFAPTTGTYTEAYVLGDYAYLADGGALVIVDVSTPGSPTQAGQLAQASGYGGIESIQVVTGSTIVYLGRSGGDVGLQVVNATTPASPSVTKTFSTQQDAKNVYVSGGALYSVDASKVWRYSLADPTNPQLVNSFTASGSNRIVVDGSYAYVADTSGVLDIYDISATTSPQQKGSYTASAVIGRVSIKNNRAYLVPYMDPNQSTTSMLEIVNVTDPNNPVKLGEFALPGLGNNVFVPDSGNLVYVVYYTNSSTHGVQIVDVSNAAAPSSVNTFQTSGKPISIWVDGTKAYVASWTLDESGWFIEAYDVSNTSSPSLVGTASGASTTIWDIKVSGDNVIATLPQGSVHVFAKAAFVGGATNIPAVGVAFAPESGEIATFVVDANTTYAYTNGGMGFYGEGEFYGSGGKYVTESS